MRTLLTLSLGLALTAVLGCSNARDQEQSQSVSPDGNTAMRTRTQVRDTPGGATVRETEVQTREVLTSPSTMPDATKQDPAR